MQFNHDKMPGVWLAEELVNMLDEDAWEIPVLENLLTNHHFRHSGLDPEVGPEVREWALHLRSVFDSPDADTRCTAVNALLDQGVRRVFLATHDGLLPHMHFADWGDTVIERLRGMTAGGLAVFVVEAGGGRLGTCARSGCRKVFADTSRGGRRAYCSAKCGNADAVHRYRNRQSK
ncbi:hypothetical protein D477_015626 [Arthrobacter crystallopoietes BAB-32]|uniref:Zinc finger CGNR domain-containing protein n=1 Tax=Arthrobacter crystallopoietes BAB-32 TaxID=1246476 RepID=N1UW96_9MICC|nr:CGNR zinc finger domain-containing protein [Arthrobacter crystallopoietes]EMY33310.1 hypothetical protein D477_015626 [Arthrobacter crystallopoietes BAB-32]